MSDAPAMKSLIAKNEQLLKECAQLREENAQLRRMLYGNNLENDLPANREIAGNYSTLDDLTDLAAPST
jgi:cell shape-determining protein MreC